MPLSLFSRIRPTNDKTSRCNLFRLRSNRFQLRLTFRLKGYVRSSSRSLFRSATRISASAGNVPTCNDVPPTRNPDTLFSVHLYRYKKEEEKEEKEKEEEEEDSRIFAPYELLTPRNSMFPFITVRFKRRFSPHFHPRGTRSSCSVLAIVKENPWVATSLRNVRSFQEGTRIAMFSNNTRKGREKHEKERENDAERLYSRSYIEQVRLNKI